VIATYLEDDCDAEVTAELYGLPRDVIDQVIAFYTEFSEAIDADIAENQAWEVAARQEWLDAQSAGT